MITPLKIFSNKEKQEIEKKLELQFGIKKISGIITMRGQERLFLYQGNLTTTQIKDLEFSRIGMERVGVYFAKVVGDKIRLSIEGIHLFKDQITKNIFELNKKQSEQFMRGEELDIQTGKNDFLIMKYKNDFIGTGKASEKKITNFIPKNRRVKNKNN